MWAGAADDALLAPLATAFVAAKHPSCPMPRTAQFTAADAAAAALTIGPAAEPTNQAVATTQVVLGMPREMARAIGWPEPLSPRMAQNLFNQDVTWKSLGHPEWGSFKLASPDPDKTPVGAVGFGALATLASGGKFLTAAPNYAQPSRADFAVVHSEPRIETVTKTTDEADALMGAASIEEFAKKASAIVTTERAVIAHNQTHPDTAFVAVPLLDGAASVPIVATPRSDAGAEEKALAGYLATPDAAATLRQAGYRNVLGEAPTVGASALAKTSTGPFPFTGEMLAGIRQVWNLMHARSSTLAVIDLSGSMKYPFDKSGVTKIALVRQLGLQAFELASPRANSSVWFFHTVDGKPAIENQLRLQRNDTPAGAGRIHSDADQAGHHQGEPRRWHAPQSRRPARLCRGIQTLCRGLRQPVADHHRWQQRGLGQQVDPLATREDRAPE